MKNRAESQRKTLNELKKISMSFEGEQECAMLCILFSEGYTIEFSVPRKSCDTCQFLDIIKLTDKSNKTIVMKDKVNEMVIQEGKQVDMTSEHHVKYERRNNVSGTTNYLIELIQHLGYETKEKGTKGAEITIKMKKLKNIKSNRIDWDSEKISEIGGQMNQRIKSFFVNKKRETLLSIQPHMIEFTDLIGENNLKKSAFTKVNNDNIIIENPKEDFIPIINDDSFEELNQPEPPKPTVDNKYDNYNIPHWDNDEPNINFLLESHDRTLHQSLRDSINSGLRNGF